MTAAQAEAARSLLREGVTECRIIRGLALALSRSLTAPPDRMTTLRAAALFRRGRMAAEHVFEGLADGAIFDYCASLDTLAIAGDELRQLRAALAELSRRVPAIRAVGNSATAALDEVAGFIAEQAGAEIRRLARLARPWLDPQRGVAAVTLDDAPVGREDAGRRASPIDRPLAARDTVDGLWGGAEDA